MKSLIYVLFLKVHFMFCQDDAVFVKLSNGEIKGRVGVTIKKETTFYAFQQIPYAAPPIGNLRFQPPQPVSNWDGILDASQNITKFCYQTKVNDERENEDCLYLNVFTVKLPSKNVNSSLPVMFFLHGGAFQMGSNNPIYYGPEFLLDYEVVIVTINYRIGAFGFLSTQDNVITGNYALRDQQFALLWVKSNIHHFGGDPEQVTIFGQSAGAASVGYQLLNGKSRGLMRGAIMESGSPISPWAFQRDARKFAFKTATYIEPTLDFKNNSTSLLQFLQKAPASDIDRAAGRISEEETFIDFQLLQGYFYSPVIEEDSENGFITEKMFESIASGKANRVPIIIGFSSEEIVGVPFDANYTGRLLGAYDNHIEWIVPNDMNAEESQKRKIGEQIRDIYTDGNFSGNLLAQVQFVSDTAWVRSILKHAALQSYYSSVYVYQFSYVGRLGNNPFGFPGLEKVSGHTEEIGYLWRWHDGLFRNYDLSIFPKEDLITQDRLLTLWTNFAKFLNPTPNKRDPLLSNVLWPKVSPGGLRSLKYLDIDTNLTIKNRPKFKRTLGWEVVYSKYGKRPFDTY